MKGRTNSENLPDHDAWFRKWFDSAFYHQLYSHRNDDEAIGFVNELVAKLQPPNGANVLDLGCGAGRHSRILASKGYNVKGLDLAASSIQRAKSFERDNLAFKQHDMRLPFGRFSFDFIFNFFTSFGYFNQLESRLIMRNIWMALRPGGVVMIDYLNVGYSETRIVENEDKEIDGVRYQIKRWQTDHHFYKKISIDNGPEYTEQVSKLRLHDFGKLLSANGIELYDVAGDYSLNTYDEEKSPRMILFGKAMP